MKVGDLVKLNLHSFFDGPDGIRNAIGVPLHSIGIIIEEKGDVCSVLFCNMKGEIKSLRKAELELISEDN